MLRKILLLAGCLLGVISGCSRQRELVIYTAHDQIYSEPIAQEFERQTGIKVKAVYDTEAAKTVGLINRLIAERDNPQCDVLWNNEFARTVVLRNRGILAPYRSPSAQEIPDRFKDPHGYWTGFAARARVIVYNRDLVKDDEAPRSIFDLTLEKWDGEVAIAKPLLGTTSTHAAALFILLGDKRARDYFRSLKSNGVRVVDGNAIVKDLVAQGEVKVGLTDTDDANIALENGRPIKVVYPDQDSIGTLVIPNTVALIRDCPHPEEAREFIDYLLSPEVEEKLAFSKAVQMPLREGVKRPEKVPSVKQLRAMKVDYEDVANKIEDTALFIREVFLR